MTSRERILCAIDHKEADRIPLDLGATTSSGVSAAAYARLKEALGMKGGHNRVYDVVQQVAQVEDAMIEKLGVDAVDIGRTFNTNDEDWVDVRLPDGTKAQWPAWFKPVPKGKDLVCYDEDGTMIAKMPDGSFFFDQTCFPYIDGYPDNYKDLDKAMGKVVWQRIAHAPWDHAADSGFWDALRAKAIELKKRSDKAIIIGCGCNLFEWGTFLRRMDNFLMDIYSDEENVERLLDALMEKHMATLEKVCESVGDVVDILRFGDDLGMDSGMFFSKAKYQKIFKPRHKQLCSYVHKHSSMKTFLHSCGSLYPIIDDIIDVGYEILNPVQTSARDMEPERLKREFGKDICFWGGGCNTRYVLNRAKPQEVYDYVRRTIDIFAPGGGFVFNQEHNILPDVPAENIIAMYKAVEDSNRRS